MNIYNPVKEELKSLKDSEDKLNKATAKVVEGIHEGISNSLANDVQGQCPKCGATMIIAKLKSREEVYYCKSCRITSPLSN